MTESTTEPTPNEPFPADGHSISDLDITTEQLSATRARSLSPVTDAVRDPSGAAGLGYLVALVDVNAAMVALCASHPDWTATADLMLHEAAPLVKGPAILESNLTRAGSRPSRKQPANCWRMPVRRSTSRNSSAPASEVSVPPLNWATTARRPAS